MVVKAKYVEIQPFQYGLAVAASTKGKSNDRQYGVLNLKGKEVVKFGKYTEIVVLDDDMLAARKLGENLKIMNLKSKAHPRAEKYGYKKIERQGDVLLTHEYNGFFSAMTLDLKSLNEFQSNGPVKVGYMGQALLLTRKKDKVLYLPASDTYPLTLPMITGIVSMGVNSPYIVLRDKSDCYRVYDCNGNLIF